MGIDYKENPFYDILIPVKKQFAFESCADKTLELVKAIKAIVDDKTKQTEWSDKEDTKAELKMDIVVILAEFGYPPIPWKIFVKTD